MALILLMVFGKRKKATVFGTCWTEGEGDSISKRFPLQIRVKIKGRG